jgi:hypothetical protein
VQNSRMLAAVVDAPLVPYPALLVHQVLERGPVLGDQDRCAVVRLHHVEDGPEPARVDRPAHRGVLDLLRDPEDVDGARHRLEVAVLDETEA